MPPGTPHKPLPSPKASASSSALGDHGLCPASLGWEEGPPSSSLPCVPGPSPGGSLTLAQVRRSSHKGGSVLSRSLALGGTVDAPRWQLEDSQGLLSRNVRQWGHWRLRHPQGRPPAWRPRRQQGAGLPPPTVPSRATSPTQQKGRRQGHFRMRHLGAGGGALSYLRQQGRGV